MKKKKTTMMRQTIISLLGAFLSLVLLSMSAAASDLRWLPRTPAGGAGYGDPADLLNIAMTARYGSLAVLARNQAVMARRAGSNGYIIGHGYSVMGDDGRVRYFYTNGDEVDMADVGRMTADETNPPFGLIYISPDVTVDTTTYMRGMP